MATLRELIGLPVLFHWLGWHGKDGNPSLTGYDSRDPNVISHQLQAMKTLGGPDFGVIALTFGPTVSPFIHQAVVNMHSQCNALNVPFALCFDPWTVNNTPDKNATMIAALKHPDIQFILNSDCYLKGKPVFDFNTGCNKTLISASMPSISYLLNGPDYDWIRIPTVPNKTSWPCAYLQFDDGTGADRNKSVWDQTKPARIVKPYAGSTFWNINYANLNAKYVQFVTWNDVSEGTEIEKFASIISRKI